MMAYITKLVLGSLVSQLLENQNEKVLHLIRPGSMAIESSTRIVKKNEKEIYVNNGGDQQTKKERGKREIKA